MVPFFQRHFLYAHKINTLWWSDVNIPDSWGFARGQITPFGINTSDGETIYAWHILPLPLYLENEEAVATQPAGYCNDFTSSESFKLLKEDPRSKLILYFHGNAGHIAQGIRPDSYRTLTDTSSFHVIAIDYRGYGHSTGAPTEQGLIADASALVDWAMSEAGVSPDRIVLLGQSLGTAVVSGVAERYIYKGIEFAGVILVAGFSNLATMLSGYRIGGIVPAMGPFATMPWFVRMLEKRVVDKWHSAERVANVVRHTQTRLRLNFIHAVNDKDIPWKEDNKLFHAAVSATMNGVDESQFEQLKEERTVHKGEDAFVSTWKADKDIVIRQELFPYGGKLFQFTTRAFH
ncbi:hypothetical protein Golomagni_06421 [Golovinomyces magnicellulatus]|nr:hypothetical protein Golomagni_06421 [Golovinomyces magnicellulatus]